MIIEKLEVGEIAANCYLVGTESSKEGIVIDPGAEGKQILRKIKDLKLEIKYIVLTHSHMDHIGAVKQVKESTNAKLAIHADDARSLQAMAEYVATYHLPVQAPPNPDFLLKGGDKINVGELSFLVLHTPGHTPGGICLLGQGVVFTGDTLFNFGIGRSDTPGGNPYQLLNSIHTKLMVLPDNITAYPGHGPPTTIGNERRWNPFLRS